LIFKCYFDGTKNSRAMILATVCGASQHWDLFEERWKAVLGRHGAGYLHTTDALALRKSFSREKGWNQNRVDQLIADCVEVISKSLEILDGLPSVPPRPGLQAITLSIDLDDFRRARQHNPNMPRSITELFMSESVSFCFRIGTRVGADSYHFHFDQGEPFYGHLVDRINHRAAREAIPLLAKIRHHERINMRVSPAIQMADLFAWCISHNDAATRGWHETLHRLPWSSLSLNYELLMNPTAGVLELVRSWKLPPRGLNPPEPEGTI
jgi:hypothetical protein